MTANLNEVARSGSGGRYSPATTSGPCGATAEGGLHAAARSHSAQLARTLGEGRPGAGPKKGDNYTTGRLRPVAR